MNQSQNTGSETVKKMEEEKQVSHVLIFPFPAQGHINQMLKLAELLCLYGLHVTFLNTEHNHHRLTRFTDVPSRLARFPGFRLEAISDGFPLDYPRSSGFVADMWQMPDLLTEMKKAIRELIISSGNKSAAGSPVTGIITDGIFTFAMDVGKELGIHTICFRTISASCMWTFFCCPKLIESGDIPFQKNPGDLDKMISSIPGMESFLRKRDLPSFFSGGKEGVSALEYAIKETLKSTQASALILNAIEELESPSLTQIRTKFHKVYTIGPLHSLLTTIKRSFADPSATSNSSSNALWEEDRSCLTWLDTKPSKSVVYVSFGSITVVNQKELLEFWHGLVNSGHLFLWVVRPDSITGEGQDIPAELEEGTKERGLLVKWAPQEEVLAHPAVGGFLTHSGWNSTLESMVAGVPMICWPHFGDQPVNSRLVGEVWKIGIDMKGTACDRERIEENVRDLMENRRDELMRRSSEIAEIACKCVWEGGSSYRSFMSLVQDLKSTCL